MSNRLDGLLATTGTAAAIRGGWHLTGDIAVIDEHGFIRITERLASFSKIAGEMVPPTVLVGSASRRTGTADCPIRSRRISPSCGRSST